MFRRVKCGVEMADRKSEDKRERKKTGLCDSQGGTGGSKNETPGIRNLY